jgi:hypothetical protein
MDKTIRNFIKRRVWALGAVAVSGWLLFPVSSVIDQEHHMPVIGICAALLFGGAILLLQLWVRCPKCSKRLGQTIAMPVALGGKKNAPNFCPYCAVSLDDPMPQAPTPTDNVTTPDKLIWK